MTPNGALGRRARDTRGSQPAFLPSAPSEALPTPHAFAFEQALTIALERAQRSRRALSIILVEIDPPNDAGVAQILSAVRETIRDSDGVWRTEPDHLWIMLADAGGPSAEPALTRLREAIRARDAGHVRIGRAAAMPGTDAQQMQVVAAFDLRVISGGPE